MGVSHRISPHTRHNRKKASLFFFQTTVKASYSLGQDAAALQQPAVQGSHTRENTVPLEDGAKRRRERREADVVQSATLSSTSSTYHLLFVLRTLANTASLQPK